MEFFEGFGRDALRYWGRDWLDLLALVVVFLSGVAVSSLRRRSPQRRPQGRRTAEPTREFETAFGDFAPSETSSQQRFRTRWGQCEQALKSAWEAERLQAAINNIAPERRWRMAMVGHEESRHWHELGLPLDINVVRKGQIHDLQGLLKSAKYRQRYRLQWLGIKVPTGCSETLATLLIEQKMQMAGVMDKWLTREPEPIQILFFKHMGLGRPHGNAHALDATIRALKKANEDEPQWYNIDENLPVLMRQWVVFESILAEMSCDERAAEFGLKVPSMEALYKAYRKLLLEGLSPHDIYVQIGTVSAALLRQNRAWGLNSKARGTPLTKPHAGANWKWIHRMIEK